MWAYFGAAAASFEEEEEEEGSEEGRLTRDFGMEAREEMDWRV
jgi:hypothetical protein